MNWMTKMQELQLLKTLDEVFCKLTFCLFEVEEVDEVERNLEIIFDDEEVEREK